MKLCRWFISENWYKLFIKYNTTFYMNSESLGIKL